jgi:hypothetical protein
VAPTSVTVADAAEEQARLGELHTARTIADRYCQDSDRLRVYGLLQSQGIPSEQDTTSEQDT